MEQGFGLFLQDGLDFLFGVVVGGFQRAFRRARLCYQIQVWTIVKVPGLKNPSLLGRQSGNGSMQSGPRALERVSHSYDYYGTR